jgi:hypothetical protein
MLFAKPFILKREAASKTGEHFDFTEVMIHQGNWLLHQLFQQKKFGINFSLI